MKTFILALAAAGIIAAPVAAAPRHDGARGANTVTQVRTVKQKPNGAVVVKTRQVVQPSYKAFGRTNYGQSRRWAKGQRFDSRYAQNYRVINPRAYRLNDAPRGYRYVRSGNDAVLVGIASGIIGAVLFGALN